MSAHVVVIGAGAAGTAAAWAARPNAKVTIVDGGVGATSLTSGAIDDQPWDQLVRAAKTLGEAPKLQPIPSSTAAFAAELGLWSLATEGSSPLVATTGGWVRPARGLDRSLLDLRSLIGRRVLLPRADRPGWDADSLARAFAAEAPVELGLTFEAVDATVLRFEDERRIADAEIASRTDDPARLAWLATELGRTRDRLGERIAFLLGPWLGAEWPRAAALSESVGVPVGEALSGSSGAAGLRFESARDRLLSRIDATTLHDKVLGIDTDGSGLRIRLRDGSTPLRATSIVLASGGLIGAGIVYDPVDYGAGPDGADGVHPPYKLSLELGGREKLGGFVGSMFGPVLDEIGWPGTDREGSLERVGIRCIDGQVADRIFAAGDLVFGHHRTVLRAVETGIRAGERAASLS